MGMSKRIYEIQRTEEDFLDDAYQYQQWLEEQQLNHVINPKKDTDATERAKSNDTDKY